MACLHILHYLIYLQIARIMKVVVPLKSVDFSTSDTMDEIQL